ncbi:MAG: hypothetical protein M3P96_10390 [Actinomycetota bacterium]|nr:hypothetical protein [Actinomycetota bacterium]
MAQRTSKTARASVRAGAAGAAGAITVLGEYKYLIPLNAGRNAYVRNIVTGRTPNLRTDSEAFVAEIRQLAEGGHAAKVRVELESLAAAHPEDGWDATLKRLEEQGVFAAA